MKPKDLTIKLEEIIGIAGDPVRLRTAIERVLLESFNMPPIQALEKAEQFEEPVRNLIAKEEETNPYPKLAIVSSAEHLVTNGASSRYGTRIH